MDWEDTFRRLRKDSGSEKLAFPLGEAVSEQVAVEEPSAPRIENTKAETSATAPSEKEEVLTSLKDLAEEKLKESGGNLKFPGGEVKVVDGPLESKESLSIEAKDDGTNLKILFVYNYSSDALALPAENRSQAPSEQLLDRMIKAMKMDEEDFEKLVVEEGQREAIFEKLASTNVEIVVPMGAIATNLILGKEERISKVHGKFFTKEVSYKNDQVKVFQVVPVFNPEMILINPNMKRSTWLDLQRIMEKLGIPLD